jgi:ligand-binding SRPBCC domain-containing protein
MPTIQSRSHVAAPIERTFAFFDDPANLARLMPPPVTIRPVRVGPLPPQAGTVIEFSYGIGRFRRSWVVRLLEHEAPTRIVDETTSGPMKRFRHSHTFSAARDGGTWIEDHVDFHVGPDGAAGMVADFLAGLAMRATFLWRQARQRQLLGHSRR